MDVPNKNIGEFAKVIVDKCSVSRKDRIQRGALYRNLYLTGDENGNPQTYNKTFSYIEDKSSYIYSPAELRFTIEKYGEMGKLDRAKGRAAASFIHRHITGASVDTMLQGAVTWALVKGKTFIEMLPEQERSGEFTRFAPYLLQPESMGVLREDIPDLDRQEAFTKVSYINLEDFQRRIRNFDAKEKRKLEKSVVKYILGSQSDQEMPGNEVLKQVLIGGLNPYQESGSAKSVGKGVVDWLGGPVPTFDPQVLANIVPVFDVWVKDSAREDDYTTIQYVGPDCVILGNIVHCNAFADDPETDFDDPNGDNPLKGHHPFIEICPNPIENYFWGRSETCNVAMLQKQINVRIDGINNLLRMQEKPPRSFIGGTGINQQTIAKINKPNGWFASADPSVKIADLAPKLPDGLYESLHESERAFDEMGGFPPVLRGRGESGVRAQGHAETLTRNAAPRFKSPALIVERQVSALGGLALDILKAKCPDKIIAWTDPKSAGALGTVPAQDPTLEPPAPGMIAIEFRLKDLDDDLKVTVDSHSSSPAFSADARGLLFDLNARGAVGPEHLLEHTGLSSADSALSELEAKQAEQAAFLAAHPEEAAKTQHKKH